MAMQSINPSNDQVLKSYPEMAELELQAILEQSQQAFAAWRTRPFAKRAELLFAAQAELLKRREEYARLMALEMGKPLAQGRAEVEKCAACCEFYARHGAAFLSPEPAATDAVKSYVSFEPLGVVLAIMPWNFPFWQVFRFAVPALTAGNAGVLKHASNVSGCSLAIEDLFRKAGFPEGLFRSLLISNKQVASLIANPLVKAVTLTGSNRAGEEVAAQAGRMLKKTVLELGGSDPFVVLGDADLERAAEVGVQSRL